MNKSSNSVWRSSGNVRRFHQHFNQLFDNNVLDTLQANSGNEMTNRIFSAANTTSGGFNLSLLESTKTPKATTRKPVKLVSNSKSLVSTYDQFTVKPTSHAGPRRRSTHTTQRAVTSVLMHRRNKKPVVFGKKQLTTAPSLNGFIVPHSPERVVVAPPKSKAKIKTRRWVNSSIDQRRYRDIHQGKLNVEGGPVIDPVEEKRVNTLRHKQLVGRTMHGTFYKGSGTHPTHWIRWNIKSYDNVCVPDALAREVFKGDPRQGVRVKCVCSGLGPGDAVAWKKRPLCETFEIVSTMQAGANSLAPTSNHSPSAGSWRSSRVPSADTSCPSRAMKVSDVGPPVWVKPVPGNPLLEAALASKPVRFSEESSKRTNINLGVRGAYSPWRKPTHLNRDFRQWRARSPSSSGEEACNGVVEAEG